MSELIDWNALTPAQRNALIAEKVMGWTSQLCDKSEPLVYYDSGDAECPRCGAYGFGTSFEHNVIPPPRYSESMDAALSALKYAIQQGTMDKEDLTYEMFDTTWGDLSTFDALEKLCAWTPDFVCRALLLAYGVEIK